VPTLRFYLPAPNAATPGASLQNKNAGLATGVGEITLGLRAFGLLYFLDQRRHDVEQVTDHAKIRDLKNRRLGILINGDD